MLDSGVISGFTVRQDALPRHFISVMMAHNRFAEFETWLASEPNVKSVDKTSGDSCYHIVYIAENVEELEHFLMRLLPHGRYRVATALRRVK